MFVLPPDFWTHFFENYWDKRPILIKQPFASTIGSWDEVLAGLRNAREHFRSSNPGTQTRLYTEDGFSPDKTELKNYLPNSNNLSVDDFFEITSQKLWGQRFAIILNNFQVSSEPLWYRTRAFMAPIIKRYPILSSDAVLFIGNYEKTPLGIHSDELSVFLFVIKGRKKIYLWPEDYFRDQFDERRDLDFELLRKDAISLEGEVGDLLFWPNSYWHVGESVGGSSISLSLGLTPLHPDEEIWADLKSKMDEIVYKAFDSESAENWTGVSNGNEGLTKVLDLAGNAMRRARRDPNFGLNLEGDRLNRVTSGSFKRVPPPLPWKTLSDDEVVQGCPAYPIKWLVDASHQLVCSANGHSFTIPADPGVIRMLKRLNGGEPHLVRDLLKYYVGTSKANGLEFVATADGIREVLSKLYSLRGISSPGG